jgi:hypothetical protein
VEDVFKFFAFICFLFSFALPVRSLKGQNIETDQPWIQKGKIFFDFTLAQETVKNMSKHSDISSKNYYRYFYAEPQNPNAIGIVGVLNSQKEITYTGNNQKLSLEYLLNSWFGIGGSLQSSVIHTHHLTKNDTELSNSRYNNMQIASAFFPELRELSDYYNTYGLLSAKQEIHFFRTFDYDLTFHFPNQGNFDPYLRVSVGRGFLTTDLVGRTGWQVGFKWKLSSEYFLSSDVFQSRLLAKSKDGETDQFLETGIRFGGGFYSTWLK